MNDVRDFVATCDAADLDTVDGLGASAATVIDSVYAEFVEMSSMVEGMTPYDYACEIFNANQESPLQDIMGTYKTYATILRRFIVLLRHPRIAQMDPLHVQGPRGSKTRPDWESMRDRMDRVFSSLHAMYSVIHSMGVLRRVGQQGHSVPFWQALVNCPPLEEDDAQNRTDQHKLILFALHKLSLMEARRFEDWVMVPTIAGGYNTTAYERLCLIEDFCPRFIDKEVDPQMWTIMTSNGRIVDFTSRVLRTHWNREFPDLERSRTTFAFKNGVYYAETNTFRPYQAADRRLGCFPDLRSMDDEALRSMQQAYSDREEMNRLMQWDFTGERTSTPSSASRAPTYDQMLQAQARQEANLLAGDTHVTPIAACVYHNHDFIPATCLHARDIATPNFDKIWDAQGFGELTDGVAVRDWIYALIGRMLYNVGDHDDWQLAPFFKGVAGTGKSTILRVIREFYASEDVGVMSNNIEGVFGLAALYNKLVVLCFEMRSDFGLDQAELQSLMSGEPMSIKVKFKTAIPNIQWKPPIAAAGNMTADWVDTSGALTRRWVIVEFAKPIAEGDPNLMASLRKEMPAILAKCNRSYLEMVREYGKRNAWDKDRVTGKPRCLPQYFHDQADRLARALNTLNSFITDSGLVLRQPADGSEEYYMSWDRFVAEYNAYCKSNNTRPMKMMSQDTYGMVLTKLSLKREEAEKPDYVDNNGDLKHKVWIFGCKMVGDISAAAPPEADGTTAIASNQ